MLLAKKVDLRNTPELKFILDNSIENGMYMSKLIDEVKAHDDEIIAQRGDDRTETVEEEDF